MLLKLCYQFTSLRQLHCISSRLFTRLSGSTLSSLCPLQWSHPLHSLWQQQLHGNYLNTIYSQPGSPTLEKEPSTCWVHSTELVIYSVLYLKEMLGTCCFLKEKTCKTIRNNVDKLEVLYRYNENRQWDWKSKLQGRRKAPICQRASLGLRIPCGQTKTACCTWMWHTEVLFAVGMVFTLLDPRIHVWPWTSCLLGWQLTVLGKLYLNFVRAMVQLTSRQWHQSPFLHTAVQIKKWKAAQVQNTLVSINYLWTDSARKERKQPTLTPFYNPTEALLE